MRTGYKVCDLMTLRPVSVDPSTPVDECSRIMAKNHVGSLLIRKGTRLLGLFTEKDIVRKVVASNRDPRKVSAKEVMKYRYPTITPEKDIYDAIVLMRDKNVRQLPVVDKKKIVGFLTGKDILKIQPQLFELLVDKIELREEDRKLKELNI